MLFIEIMNFRFVENILYFNPDMSASCEIFSSTIFYVGRLHHARNHRSVAASA